MPIRYARLDETSIAYDILGSGDQDLVLLIGEFIPIDMPNPTELIGAMLGPSANLTVLLETHGPGYEVAAGLLSDRFWARRATATTSRRNCAGNAFGERSRAEC